jgi:YidC/Oxa1 family membrane protein insertase
MPKEKNTFLRVLVPVLVGLAGVGIAAAIFTNAGRSAPLGPAALPSGGARPQGGASGVGTTDPARDAAAATSANGATTGGAPKIGDPARGSPTAGEAGGAGAGAGEGGGPASPSAVAPAVNGPAEWVLQPVVWGTDVQETSPPLGSLDEASQDSLRIEFSNGGAGVRSLRLNRVHQTIRRAEHEQIQGELARGEGQAFSALVPMSALLVEVTPPAAPGQVARSVSVNLFANTAGPIWQADPSAPGLFRARVVDGSGAPVLEIVRRYALGGASAQVTLTQTIENKTSMPLAVRWFQMGPVDLPQEGVGYGGDKRRVRFGYLLSANADPTRRVVVSSEHVIPHESAVGPRESWGVDASLWPNTLSKDAQHEMVWAGLTNRYFGVAMHAAQAGGSAGGLAGGTSGGGVARLAWPATITRVVHATGAGGSTGTLGMRLDSAALQLAPAGLAGSTGDVSLAIFAGPLDKTIINADAGRKVLGLGGLVLYNFGGMCGWCTFPFMTGLLFGLMHTLHDYVFHDWSLAIIFLVLVVRSILHPVTRWSQIRMARFGKQMGAMAPKQRLIQEKYKDDPKRMQQEMARLWREEGISPAGFLGCLPMFLQMPVWIALYATLYFAVELRHTGAFYGVFQAIQPASSPFWQFLGDLSEPDRFLYAGRTLVDIPLLGPINALNVLPLVLAVVFFIQQKYLTPPTAGPLTPEQEMQQKMMKWMTVVLFPLFMYNAPSGLSLYFIANSTLGILESKWIRAHMDNKGLLDLEKIKAERAAKRKNKGGEGFLERIQRIAEEQQKMRQGAQGKK